MIKLFKKLDDGRYIFEKEGVYFAVTKSQVHDMILEIIEYEANNGHTTT